MISFKLCWQSINRAENECYVRVLGSGVGPFMISVLFNFLPVYSIFKTFKKECNPGPNDTFSIFSLHKNVIKPGSVGTRYILGARKYIFEWEKLYKQGG